MPRKRTDVVTESRARLLELERRSSGSRRSRLKAIRLIKERPEDRLSDIAASMGVSITALGRWWALYRQGGLDGLLETKQRGGYRPSKVDQQLIEMIGSLRERGELASQRDVQQWLLQEHGVKVSRSGVAYLLKTRVAARTHTGSKRADPKPSAIQRSRKKSVASQTDADLLIDMLGKLPRSTDPVTWIEEIRAALAPLLDDVTRISLDINTRCDLLSPSDYLPDIAFIRTLGVDANDGEVFIIPAQDKGAMAQSIIARFIASGVNVEQFHPPLWREYYYEGTAYLGSFIFWRDLTLPPISDTTLRLIDRLESFIIFLLSDFVARYDYAHPLERIFHDILGTISFEYSLSVNERRVLGLQLQGKSYKSIAARLHISQSTVRKHLTSIHGKTGTSSSLELFARYFTPQLASIHVPGSE